jgi:hypothetical protein
LLATAWSEVLDGEIPEKYLEPSYLRAMRDKESGFALSSNDMVKAYRDICLSERSAPRLAQATNLLSGDVCPKCFGSGMEQYVEGGYKQVRRCDHAPTPRAEDDDSDIQNW